jgi:hypothetical protein
MSGIQIYEANRGTRNEAETGALILEHARTHLLDGLDAGMGNVDLADIQAGIVLLNLSLLVFPEQEPKIKGAVPCPSLP